MIEIVLLVQAAATWALTGLIWTIQVVHYPLLSGLAPDTYPAWQRRHMTRITAVVGPLMVAEGLTAALALLVAVPSGAESLRAWSWAGILLLALIWLSTALVQAPIHGKLTAGFDAELHRRLVRSNWLRTTLWTARAIMMFVMLAEHRLQVP